jgi:PAS domain S-box-containing protein
MMPFCIRIPPNLPATTCFSTMSRQCSTRRFIFAANLQGVLCLEQVGTRQPWTPAQQIFAQAVANLVTLALVEYEAEEARRQAQAANERLRAVFDASRDALFLADGDSGEILDLNRQAEILVGRERKELLGLIRERLYPPEQQQRAAGEFRRLLEGASPWALVTEVRHREGRRLPVEVTAEVADLSDGRRLALEHFSPILGFDRSNCLGQRINSPSSSRRQPLNPDRRHSG